MKLIIAGGRNIDVNDALKLIDAMISINDINNITEIVCGMCPKGVDLAGLKYSSENNIKLKPFPAKWKRYGKKAGRIRNREMAEYADALLLIWDGYSPGSYNMKTEMEALKKPIFEHVTTERK